MTIKNPRYRQWWAGRRLRHPQGHGVPTSKLTPQDVLGMRRRAAAGETYAALGRAYGVAPETVSEIVRGKRWAHLPLVEKEGA